jgi:uncharacterized membrane protein YdfJ with MMPL/SSD domain
MPAFMHVMGEWNWWAPKWLTRITSGSDSITAPSCQVR